jgi:hypothetical protein
MRLVSLSSRLVFVVVKYSAVKEFLMYLVSPFVVVSLLACPPQSVDAAS